MVQHLFSFRRSDMKTGDLVRFRTGMLRPIIGLVIGKRFEKCNITGQGAVYDVLTPDDGVLPLPESALQLVQDGTERDMIQG